MIRSGPIRVLIIDDSPVYAKLLAAELERQDDLHALAGSPDPIRLRDQLIRIHPEVVVLDLGLRAHDPFDLLYKLRVHYPVPLIVTTCGDQASVARALRDGAREALRKPVNTRPAALKPFARDLAGRIRVAASEVPSIPRASSLAGQATSFRAAGLDPNRHVVAVGASTGGTKALADLLEHMPADSPPIVIVQHMPTGFTRSFAERLNSRSAVAVAEAGDGDVLRPGHAVLARGDTHLVVQGVTGPWRVRYTDQRLVNRHCPSVDVLFDSAADTLGRNSVGILLTGMGADGAQGLLRLRHAGAVTIAQNQASCVVYGMPKVAADLGAVMHSVAPEEMPPLILRALTARSRPPRDVSAAERRA